MIFRYVTTIQKPGVLIAYTAFDYSNPIIQGGRCEKVFKNYGRLSYKCWIHAFRILHVISILFSLHLPEQTDYAKNFVDTHGQARGTLPYGPLVLTSHFLKFGGPTTHPSR